MDRQFVFLLICGLALSFGSGAEISIVDYGAIPTITDLGVVQGNTAACVAALQAAQSGDVVIVPALTFYAIGGIYASNLNNITLQIDGTLRALPDFNAWPHSGSHYLHLIELTNCTHCTLTGSGEIDGQGVPWWNAEILGKLKYERPKLVVIQLSYHLLVENVRLVNSPSFHLLLSQDKFVEVSHVGVFVEREAMAAAKQLKARVRARSRARHLLAHNSSLSPAAAAAAAMTAGTVGGWPLEPEDLNTDGIDPSGSDFWIHDCVIDNDDDSIAVKPSNGGDAVAGGCSQNMLIENMVLMGFGASIGSVPPNPRLNCVRNITFRNISMPQSGKGIYIKSNPTCSGDAANRAIISDVTYSDVTITQPRWWAIWIGPQQQHEPHSALGRKCSLFYPLNPGGGCPTQGCVTFANITLRNVAVVKPWLSPGVVLGNTTNPMRGLLFDNVVVTDPGTFPFPNASYRVESAQGECRGCSPVPPSFKVID